MLHQVTIRWSMLALLWSQSGCGFLALSACGPAGGGPVCKALPTKSIDLRLPGMYPRIEHGNKSASQCCDELWFHVDHRNAIDFEDGTGRNLAGLVVGVKVWNSDGEQIGTGEIPIPSSDRAAPNGEQVTHYKLKVDMPAVEEATGLDTLPCGFKIELNLSATQRGHVADDSELTPIVPPQHINTTTFECSKELCDDKQAMLPGSGSSVDDELAMTMDGALALGVSLLDYVEIAYGTHPYDLGIEWQRGFVRGDINHDGAVDLDDWVHLVGVLESGVLGSCACAEASDVYDDGMLDSRDTEALLELIDAYELGELDYDNVDLVEIDEDGDTLTCVFPASEDTCKGSMHLDESQR